MKQHRVRIILWISVIGTAIMIFMFSSQPGDTSWNTSGTIVEQVVQLTYPEYENLLPEKQESVYLTYQMIIRKSAHFLEFALLGFLIKLLFWSYGKPNTSGWWAWGISTGYAALDEIHQLFMQNRAGMWQDVCIDSLGALAGVLCAIGAIALWRKRQGDIRPLGTPN